MDAKKKAESRAKSNANLRPKPPINERPPEEQLEIRRKGQRASLEVVRRKKAIKDMMAHQIRKKFWLLTIRAF